MDASHGVHIHWIGRESQLRSTCFERFATLGWSFVVDDRQQIAFDVAVVDARTRDAMHRASDMRASAPVAPMILLADDIDAVAGYADVSALLVGPPLETTRVGLPGHIHVQRARRALGRVWVSAVYAGDRLL